MYKHIGTFSEISFLIFLCFCSGIFSVTKIKRYRRFDALNARTCMTGDIVFDDWNIHSVTNCLVLCSRKASCAGISYEMSKQECIGCNEQIFQSNSSDIFENALFYRLDECPDKSGKIQLGIDFRLQLHVTEKNQSEAELECKSKPNGHLVVLDEEWKINEVDHILTSCEGYNSTYFWVDGKRPNKTSAWKYSDGRNVPMSQTIYWHADSPNSPYPKSLCLRMSYRESGSYRLDDRRCHQPYSFICEY